MTKDGQARLDRLVMWIKLHRLDLLADGRLGRAELHRRSGKTAMTGRRLEGAQAVQQGAAQAGGALAQALPLLLGPWLTRLYRPEDFGAYHLFAALAANLAVVACARYEFALPLARDDGEATALRRLTRIHVRSTEQPVNPEELDDFLHRLANVMKN